jgi:hypothetical protein
MSMNNILLRKRNYITYLEKITYISSLLIFLMKERSNEYPTLKGRDLTLTRLYFY